MRQYKTRLVQQVTHGQDMWTASHPDLPGCHTVAPDPTLALTDLEAVRAEWLARATAQGRRVPPADEDATFELVMDPGHSVEDLARARKAIQAASDDASSEQANTISLSGELEEA